jgi:hypothetical protein
MEFQLEEALEVLAETPAVLLSLLGGKSNVWLDCRKQEDAFSPRDVVGHLIHAEMTNWIPRVRTILKVGDTHPFDGFERFNFRELIAGKSINESLSEFAVLRSESMTELGVLVADSDLLSTKGLHPDLGAVTLGNMLATWVVHDLGHISQIVKAMASNYREAVGPWRAYVTILD